MAAPSSKLFQPFKVGDITPQHHVVMAPLTRFRANDEHAHSQIGIEYYTQRASMPGTLIITEATEDPGILLWSWDDKYSGVLATVIAAEAGQYTNVPGIYTDDQIAAWKKITDAVHAKGSFIYLQLWALGRTANPNVLASEGNEFVAPSAIPMPGGPTPRALTKIEVKHFVHLFAEAARNAVFRAGFDGVEIHGANGYLIHQFIEDNSNQRTDEYGGSIENRSRFALEIVKAVTDVVGESKTGIRFSPWNTFQGMCMEDPIPTYTHLISTIRDKYPNFAYLHVIETDGTGPAEDSNKFARELWQPRPYFSAGQHNAETGLKVADEKDVAVVYGRWFISNPDLPLRIKHGVELTPYDAPTFYAHGTDKVKGYINYPFSDKILAATVPPIDQAEPVPPADWLPSHHVEIAAKV